MEDAARSQINAALNVLIIKKMFSWQLIKKFLCNLFCTDNTPMMGIKTLAISLGQAISVAEIVLFCQTGIFPWGHGV